MSQGDNRGFSVRIFMPSGDPDGIRIIDKTGWIGIGLVFPRSLFKEARRKAELERTGIYVLEGPSEQMNLPQVYVGEGDPSLPRLEQHVRHKEFWTRAVVFTSKDSSLNKAHIKYLEARLLQLAAEANRCELDNGNVPQLPSLSDADAAEAEAFLYNVRLCLPVLGVHAFEKIKARTSTTKDLILRAKKIHATGFESPQGFVVRSGSRAVKDEVPKIPPYHTRLRRDLVSKGVLKLDGESYLLVQDYAFDSPSSAAGVLLGGSVNGLKEWKTPDGKTLKEKQESEASR